MEKEFKQIGIQYENQLKKHLREGLRLKGFEFEDDISFVKFLRQNVVRYLFSYNEEFGTKDYLNNGQVFLREKEIQFISEVKNGTCDARLEISFEYM